ncbi:MAG: FAD-binding protein [Syntrophales bacterium]|nr:FAD-binding protein [Syntrophales bacterium]
MNESVKERIRHLVGRENCLDGELDLFGYSYDASFVPLEAKQRPELVVRPGTTEEVSQILKLAYEHAIPVTPRGAASGRTGGSIPVAGGISLTLDRMTKILELDAANMMVTVEAGVRTSDVYDFCSTQGLFYPPDPASWKFSTIGGNIAENAGGMRAVKYGVTKNYVMGLEVVLADGTIIQTGGKAIKNVTGYDLTSLFIGSEGTLGVITKAILRLIPLPKMRNTIQIMFPNLEAGCLTVQKMLVSGITPAAAEIMDKICLEAVSKYRKIPINPEVGSCLIIEIDGNYEPEIERQIEAIRSIADDFDTLSFRVAKDSKETEELWAIRRGISSAIASLAPDRIGEDISVPRSAFPEVVRRIESIAKKFNLTVAVYGHAGDGNIHPSILCNLKNPEEEKRVHEAVEEIFESALAVGGTLSGEHGIGITKKPYIRKALGDSGVATLKAIKIALDPKGILNPGKIW